MIAALPMYDWPEARGANDAFWARVATALRAAGIAAPEGLSRGPDPESHWTADDLLLGQTCGLPYVAGMCGAAVLVGRPVYAVEGAGAGMYRSALICRADDIGELADFRGRRAAVNQYGSQSGCNALADAVAGHGAPPFFGEVMLSGAHRASAVMVADGKADLAAVDAVAWAMLARFEPARHAALRVLEWTSATPALPFITAQRFAGSVPEIRSALNGAGGSDAGPAVPVEVLPATGEDYDPIRRMLDRVRGTLLAPGQPPI